MPELIADKKVFSLLELGQSIKRMFDTHYSKRYWVKAEMNKLNLYGRSGHCFPDLVEKKDGKIIAEMRGILWKGDYQRIDKEFNTLLGEPLKEGIKILMQCTVNFDPHYGLSLRIVDIDVNFTLGDLAREKKETLARLSREGLLDANKKKPMPLLPKRVAVISVETSNGYSDFVKVIETNSNGYKVSYTLFPSLLQGDRAIAAMLRQLEEIRKRKEEFDLVAIIRGGGGDIGLSFLNNYELAHTVATFPLPLVTGIGHATNQTVVESIAYKDAITPTELAEWLLHQFYVLDQSLDKASDSLALIPREILFGAWQSLESSMKFLRTEARRSLTSYRHSLLTREGELRLQSQWQLERSADRIARLSSGLESRSYAVISDREKELGRTQVQLQAGASRTLRQKRERMEMNARSIHNMSPEAVLKRGYSISRVKGMAIKQTDEVEVGSIIETQFFAGMAISEIKEIKENE